MHARSRMDAVVIHSSFGKPTVGRWRAGLQNAARRTARLCFALLAAFALPAGVGAEEESAAALQMPPGKPVEVKVSVDLVEVSQIVDHDQKFELEFNVFYTWHDPRFVFDPAREGVTSKLIPAEDVWNPEPELCDELDVDVRGGKAVRAYSDGTLSFSRYYRGTVGGSLDLHEFPLDRHTLEVDLEESVFEADQVVFVPAGRKPRYPSERCRTVGS